MCCSVEQRKYDKILPDESDKYCSILQNKWEKPLSLHFINSFRRCFFVHILYTFAFYVGICFFTGKIIGYF